MQKYIVQKCLNYIKRYHPEYDDIKIEEIEYGLISIYLVITKFIIIATLAIFLHTLKEMITFLILYNIIRATSFGIHANKSGICLFISSIIFIGCPYLCKYITIAEPIKLILGIISIYFIYKHSPADTEKRPIVNKNRRKKLQLISTLTAIIFVLISITTKNNFISNGTLISLIIQNIVIAPITYKLLKTPYANYKNYISNSEQMV